MNFRGNVFWLSLAIAVIAGAIAVLLVKCDQKPLKLTSPAPLPTRSDNPVTPALPPSPPALSSSKPTTSDVTKNSPTPLPYLPVTPAPIASEVSIQDGKTIDFSSGRAVIRDSEKEKAIIDAAVKEMDAATQGVTFAPIAPLATATPTPH